MGKLFGVEEEKSSRMMHCSAPTGAARAATIAIVAGLRARTLAAELRIPKRMFFKANQPSVLAIVNQATERFVQARRTYMLEDLPALWRSHCIIGLHRFHTLLANTCAGALSCDGSGNEYTFPRQRKSTNLMITSLPRTRTKICLNSGVEIIDIEPAITCRITTVHQPTLKTFRW